MPLCKLALFCQQHYILVHHSTHNTTRSLILLKQFILSFGDTGTAEIITIKLLLMDIVCFHMTSWWPYLCPKTMKRQPCLCPKPVLWELNSFLM